ncbi:MAG: septation protein A [Gammaproteobacteria bacterium]|nr:septation protein A [Gammaproteobacteria bacterium]
MKLLFDLFPVLLFFAAYKLYDIYVATAVAIVAGLLQVAYGWLRHRRVEKAHVATAALLVVFGGLTLVLQDELFIKWKPTLLDWLFAAVFLGSRHVGNRRPLVQRMMGGTVDVAGAVWERLNTLWVCFFVAMGVLNLVVVYNFDTDTWVNFKLFGMLGLTFLFVLAQAFYLARHMAPETTTDGDS